MKTEATDHFPEIQWERTSEILEQDSEERLTVYKAIGFDAHGLKYTGEAHYVCGEWEEVREIELN